MIEHIAIWTRNLEEMKAFYCSFFHGCAHEKYVSRSVMHPGFESYFISFGDGCRLELMHLPDMPDGDAGDRNKRMGLAHVAFSMKTREQVGALVVKAGEMGLPVLQEPRMTGDGYYEACMLDPEGNLVEITAP